LIIIHLIFLLTLTTCSHLRTGTDDIPRIDRAVLEKEDVFAREPFVGRFKVGSIDFSLIGVHITPDTYETSAELNKLDDIYDYTSGYYNDPDALILGDLNADCKYLSNAKADALDLNSVRFDWLISKDEDTTVSPSTDCAYDRIIRAGNLKVKDTNINDDIEDDLSDHYAVGTTLITDQGDIKIGAWNVKVFGPSKSGDEDKLLRIAGIISKYDLIFIQEVRGPLVEGRLKSNLPKHFEIVSSPGLGRSTHEEIYFYVFNTKKVKLLDAFVAPDGK